MVLTMTHMTPEDINCEFCDISLPDYCYACAFCHISYCSNCIDYVCAKCGCCSQCEGEVHKYGTDVCNNCKRRQLY